MFKRLGPVAILGAPGIGKTFVSRAVASDPSIDAVFPTRSYGVSNAGLYEPDELHNAIATELGVAVAAAIARASRAAFLAPDPRWLRRIPYAAPLWEYVGWLSDAPGGTIVCCVSGRHLPTEVAWGFHCEVRPLSDADARAMVPCRPQDPISQQRLDELITAVGGHPYSLRILQPFAQTVLGIKAIYEEFQRVGTQGLHDDGELDVAALLDRAIGRLPDAASDLLTLLAQLPDGVDVDDFDAVAPRRGMDRRLLYAAALVDESDVRLELHSLTRRHLPTADATFPGVAEACRFYCEIARDRGPCVACPTAPVPRGASPTNGRTSAGRSRWRLVMSLCTRSASPRRWR